MILLGLYLFLKYGFLWISPFLFAYLIYRIIDSLTKKINHFFSFSIPLLSFLLYFIFLFLFFSCFSLLSFSLIRFITLFLQTDFLNQLVQFSHSFTQLPYASLILDSFIQQLIPFLSATLLVFPQVLTFLALSCFIVLLLLIHPHPFDPYFSQLSYTCQHKLSFIHTSLLKTMKHLLGSSCQLMLITWIECLVGLLFIREPHAISLSLFIACFDSLPLFGVGTVLIPLSLSQYFFGFPKKALALFILYLIMTFLRFFIEPKIMSNHMGIPVFFHLLSMMVCVNLFGPIGFLYAPFICVTLLDFFHRKQDVDHTNKKETLL